MDRTISEKFGPTFKKRLEASADSLFIIRSLVSTVDYIHCDTKPHLPGKPEGPDPEIYIAVPSNLIPQPRPQSGDYGPFMDISFIIEKSGQGHNFASTTLIDADYNSGDITQFQDRLWQIAQVELAKVPFWVPGTLAGQPVRTRANVRVHFEALKAR